MPSATSGQALFMRLYPPGRVSTRLALTRPGLAVRSMVAGFDADRMHLLQVAEADDQLVELGAFQPHADAVVAVRRLAGERQSRGRIRAPRGR